jgi:hypothetical protein
MQAIMTFEDLASKIKTNLGYKEALLNYEGLYNLKKFKFTDISTDSAILMFRNIVDKYTNGSNIGFIKGMGLANQEHGFKISSGYSFGLLSAT